MSNIRGGLIVSAPFSQFNSFQELLDMIYLNFLESTIRVKSYGSDWILKHKKSGKVFIKNQLIDKRRLEEIGINPGDNLILEKIEY